MPTRGKVKLLPDVEADGTPAGSVREALVEALEDDGVTPSELLECLYYAGEQDLMAIMRVLAALESADRAKVAEFAKAFRGESDARKRH